MQTAPPAGESVGERRQRRDRHGEATARVQPRSSPLVGGVSATPLRQALPQPCRGDRRWQGRRAARLRQRAAHCRRVSQPTL